MTEYVTRDELAAILREQTAMLDRRFGRIERWLGLLSTATVIQLMVVIYLAAHLPQ